MKKISGVLLLIICSVFVFTACASKKAYVLAKENIAEARHNMYLGEGENVRVTLMSGLREKDYVINGYCTDNIEFGVLTFELKTDITLPEVVNFVLNVGTLRNEGVLERNPYDGTLVCDVKKIIDSDEVITAKIIAGELVEGVELKSVTKNWNVSYLNALNLACSELNKELKGFIENGNFLGECYIKIVSDREVDENYFYWFVNFVSRNGKSYAVVIDPISNEVLAKKAA